MLDGRGRVLKQADFDACEALFADRQAERPLEHDHLVVLLHGLGRSRGAMAPMARGLQAHGYAVATVHYPSTRRDLDGHAGQVDGVLSRTVGPSRVSFVGHSLGGLVARQVLARPDAPWRARIDAHRLVTIATPHQGAAMAARLAQVPGLGAAAGPVLKALLPGAPAERLPPPSVPFATIAGGRGHERGLNPWLSGDDDLTVSVAEAMLEGAEATWVVDAVHTFVMMDRRVIEAVARYLDTGQLTPETA